MKIGDKVTLKARRDICGRDWPAVPGMTVVAIYPVKNPIIRDCVGNTRILARIGNSTFDSFSHEFEPSKI